jgi:hypothetical protein
MYSDRQMSHPVQDFIAWWLSQPLFWAALGAVCGPYLFFRGFRLLQLKRLLMDVPRSSIHAAALGPVEVSGKAVGPYTVVSPFSRSNCLYYRVVKRSAGQTNIREMCAPLFLEDETGRVMVYPRGAKLQLESFDSDGKLRSALMRVAWASQLLDLRWSAGGSDWTQEFCIKPGDTVFVLGKLCENRWAAKREDDHRSALAEEGSIEDDASLSRIGPGFVSQGEADLQQEIFDVGLPSSAGASATDFDLGPPVIVMEGTNCPFIISTESQREVVSKLSWKSILYIWVGPLVALWGLWEILVKRPGIIGSPFQ